MSAMPVLSGAQLPPGLHGRVAGEILAIMGRRKISQKRLADALGVDQSTVSRWLNRSMSITELDRMCATLGLQPTLSFGEATAPKPGSKGKGWTPELLRGGGQGQLPRSLLVASVPTPATTVRN